MGKFRDLTGQRFGRLLVLHLGKRSPSGNLRWLCLCSCGTETLVFRAALLGGLTTSCGCYKRELQFQGVGELSKTYWAKIKKGARKRNLPFKITIEEAWELYLEQDKKCAVSRIPITIVSDYTYKHNEHTASLDRIDNNEGYTLGNIQWVHRDVNMMRRKIPMTTFIWYCKQIAKNNE